MSAAALLDTVVAALEPYDIPTGRWSPEEKIEPAQRVLDALGLECVGWISDRGNLHKGCARFTDAHRGCVRVFTSTPPSGSPSPTKGETDG